MERRRPLALALLLVAVVALAPRALWLRADPPAVGGPGGVGIVWHDEGAWVHNARNRALWGTWQTDAWNPIFVAPVFTALEYGAFRLVGVGTWQARTVSVVFGVVAVLALMVGLAAVAGRRAAIAGGLLLSLNYVFIMWNRAALMETTMTGFLVCAWAAYALGSGRTQAWGAAAAVAAALAWFTKASAAFFVAALVVDGAWRLVGRSRTSERLTGTAERRLALFTIGGLVAAAAAAAVLVAPHWADYQFYNWQMSVTRKPEFSLAAFVDRASWIPIVQGLFSQAWIVCAAGLAGGLAVLTRWRTAAPAERLLVWWLAIGFAELVVHDSGNERRYVMFLPAFAALAAIALGSGRPLFERGLVGASRLYRLAAVPVLLWTTYLLVGTFVRPTMLARLEAGDLAPSVRLSALAAVLATAAIVWQWDRLTRLLGGRSVPLRALLAVLTVSAVWDAGLYARWAGDRQQRNVDASVALGALLPAGTLVQGKLANGMALDNRIRPLFVGNGFGNYDDRLERDDVRYVLTYDLPRLGYESSDGSGLIAEILDEYPGWQTVATFEVDETPGPDRAMLVDKFPEAAALHAHD